MATQNELEQMEKRIQDKIDSVASSHEKKVKICLNEMSAQFDSKIDSVIQAAFVAGDMSGHKNYHQLQIDWMRARNEFIRKVLFDLTRVGVFAGLGIIVTACWTLLMMEIKK